MSPPAGIQPRIRGALFGLATVDALGGPVEFKPRHSFPLLTEMLPNDNFDLPAGCWTDDTSMTLCLADSLTATYPAYDAADCVKRYLRWMTDSYLGSSDTCFDIGNTTLDALTSWEGLLEHDDRLEPGTEAYVKMVDKAQAAIDRKFNQERYCGNGSLMRVLPVSLLHFDDHARAMYVAEMSSRATHPHEKNIRACQLYTALVVRTLKGGSKEDMCKSIAGGEYGPELEKRFGALRTPADWEQRPEKSVNSSGFVLSTLDAALWSFFSTATFEAGAIRAVNLGEDADTVGAVYGGLAGAFYGIDAIPQRWLSQLVKQELIEGVLEAVLKVIERD